MFNSLRSVITFFILTTWKNEWFTFWSLNDQAKVLILFRVYYYYFTYWNVGLRYLLLVVRSPVLAPMTGFSADLLFSSERSFLACFPSGQRVMPNPQQRWCNGGGGKERRCVDEVFYEGPDTRSQHSRWSCCKLSSKDTCEAYQATRWPEIDGYSARRHHGSRGQPGWNRSPNGSRCRRFRQLCDFSSCHSPFCIISSLRCW